MANSRYKGNLSKNIFNGCKTLKMANWDMGGITLKTIFYGRNTLKMANSRYRGITHKHIKHSKYGKFFIDETLWKWQISDIASILKITFYGHKNLKMANSAVKK